MSSPRPLAEVLFLESYTVSQGRTSYWVAARCLQRTVETKEAGGSISQNAADGILFDWWGRGLTSGNDLIRASCLERLSWGPARKVELVAELVRRFESRRKRVVTQTESQVVGAGKGEGISRQPDTKRRLPSVGATRGSCGVWQPCFWLWQQGRWWGPARAGTQQEQDAGQRRVEKTTDLDPAVNLPGGDPGKDIQRDVLIRVD